MRRRTTPRAIEWLDLSAAPDSEQTKTIEAAAAKAQTSLNLENGPLWRLVYFDLGRRGRPAAGRRPPFGDGRRVLASAARGPRDGLSQLEAGGAVTAAAEDVLVQGWAEQLERFAASETLKRERAYWSRCRADAADTSGGNLRHRLKALPRIPSRHRACQEHPHGRSNARAAAAGSRCLQHADQRRAADCASRSRGTGGAAARASSRTSKATAARRYSTISMFRGRLGGSRPSFRSASSYLHRRQNRARRRAQVRQGTASPRSAARHRLRRPTVPDRRQRSAIRARAGDGVQLPRPARSGCRGFEAFQFRAESTGPWHSPRQRRRHALEINSLVIGGRLELWWTYSAKRCSRSLESRRWRTTSSSAIEQLDRSLPVARRGRPHSVRFSARLAGSERSGRPGRRQAGHRRYLSAIADSDAVLLGAARGPCSSSFDQWQCTLRGTLNVTAFQEAWHETTAPPPILRSTIHGDGSAEPVQVVHRDVKLPWTIEDWRWHHRWSTARSAGLALLTADRAQPLNLTDAPPMRFALVRVGSRRWKFLWSVPALLLDGWSWPLVFRDVSRALRAAFDRADAAQLEAARPYRDYVEWLRQSVPPRRRSSGGKSRRIPQADAAAEANAVPPSRDRQPVCRASRSQLLGRGDRRAPTGGARACKSR